MEDGMIEEVVGCREPLGEGLYNMWLTEERIVRCRDCKYFHIVRSWLGTDMDECWLHASRESGALGKEYVEPNGFCSWGKPKEDA